jgi:hypothetical protein
VSGLLKDALENGTLSWDVVLCRVASIVLTSALSRSCDVALCTQYTDRKIKKHKAYVEIATPQVAKETSLSSIYDNLLFLCYGRTIYRIERNINRNRTFHQCFGPL